MSSATKFCRRCRAPLAQDAKFCNGCGTRTRIADERQAEQLQRLRQRGSRATAAIATVFGGVMAIILLVGALASTQDWNGLEADVVAGIGFLAVGALATWLLGERFRATLGGAPTREDWLLAPIVAVVGVSISIAYVDGLLGADNAPLDYSLPYLVLTMAIFPAVFEEWLDRGVLWCAARKVADQRTTIWLSGTLFALMHIYQGIVTLPHRFVLGVALAWLRARTGSLAGPILAHFLHNLLAVLWGQWSSN